RVCAGSGVVVIVHRSTPSTLLRGATQVRTPRWSYRSPAHSLPLTHRAYDAKHEPATTAATDERVREAAARGRGRSAARRRIRLGGRRAVDGAAVLQEARDSCGSR